jgi:hypothetical protein
MATRESSRCTACALCTMSLVGSGFQPG